ncbi:Peptidyl-prolyl cis-trans isomerase CWC27 like protein [Eufriesea mexicana]|uniref:Peptidyl-prolyl cis-trans isomerase CWC27 like protein n=1 Tax=Eufriesea mexicana TaxID=516756 RepID=A0A310SJ27_9HYME|nr:Peptidyl-prolyl cis-trans isomerase CWC27 like protein [Eufriesea mexicana]
MANAGKDDNTFQFLFTLGSTSELQSKHTIFGKFTGGTIYNMLKLEKTLVDENDGLLYPPRIRKTEILNNPFSDIIPRIIVQESEEVKENSKTKTAAIFLSFGKEAEEVEENFVILNKKFSGKDKSAHDHLTDLKFNSQLATKVTTKAMEERIRNKLRGTKKEPKKVESYKIDDVECDKDVKENE